MITVSKELQTGAIEKAKKSAHTVVSFVSYANFAFQAYPLHI